VKAAHDDNPIGLNHVEEPVRETPQQSAPHIAVNHEMAIRMASDSGDNCIDRTFEIVA
jgi:hypothetical protein